MQRLNYRGMLAAGAVMLGCASHAAAQPVDSAAHNAETVRNRAIVTKFADLFYTKRDVRQAFSTYVVPDYIQHNPAVADGRDAAVGSLLKIFGMPGGQFEVKQIVVDGDYAVVHVRAQPSPKMPVLAVFDMYRLKNGKIAEHWDVLSPIPSKSANPHPMF